MTKLFILPALLLAAMINPPARQYFLSKDKAVFVKYKNWDIQDPNRWWVDYEAAEVDHRQALRVFALRWATDYNLKDFAALSKVWSAPEPNVPVITPPEPNEPAVDTAFGHICYTIGGKQHLYDDCRYIIGKDWIPCVCDPNNICLTCKARRANDYLP